MADRPTVLISHNGRVFKVFKVWFGVDGSYYVTVPYHSHSDAIVCKATVNYDAGHQQIVLMKDFPLIADLDDDEQRLKLSHHPDGFCQFSGHGILSGRDDRGEPKGVGVLAAPLADVGAGPAFSVCVHGLEHFHEANNVRAGDLVIEASSVLGLAGENDLCLEGHYFQPQFRRFVYSDSAGKHFINIPHPSGVILNLRVLAANPEAVAYAGFIGIDCFRARMRLPGPGYSLSGPGERARLNDKGERLADNLVAMFPRPRGASVDLNLNFPPRSSVV